MSIRNVVFALSVALLFGCGGERDASSGAAALTPMDASSAGVATRLPAASPGRGFANAPDRGTLMSYPEAAVRRDGAYTWRRVELSEAHALNSVASGRLRVVTPAGRILDLQYDRMIEHPSGDWTWIGHRPGHEGEQTILTFGAQAAHGSIALDDGPPLRLLARNGISWLLETDPAAIATVAAARVRQPDYRLVPESARPKAQGDAQQTATPTGARSAASSTQGSAAIAAPTVDVIVGYTTGFANAQGGTSGAITRLNFLVDVANAAYDNSSVGGAHVRMVKAMQVSYTDTNDNETALEQISGYSSDSNGPVPPHTAFKALREAREQYGADLVTLVRDFSTPENGGCGIAWLLGGGLEGIGPDEGWDEFAYSVVQDGYDQGTDGKSYYCQDETLVHEFGHNMGAAHDRETAKGDDGVLDNPGDYGAHTYSFGYKTGAAAGNFYTVMAYGETGQTRYRIFSNPGSTFCGGRACGKTTDDNARALRQTMPVVAGFRATALASNELAPGIARSDINGDGKDDLLYRNGGQFAYWLMSGTTRIGWKAYSVNPGTRFAGYGDFDRNGRADLVWVDANRGVFMWLGRTSGFAYKKTHTHGPEWTLAGMADCNGDGRDDLLWYSPQLGQLVVWYMNGFDRTGYRVFAVPGGYRFAGSGDFNSDGKADLLWDNPARNLYMWTGNGTAFAKTYLRTFASGWSLIGTRDVNGDGRSDMQWRNQASGQFTYWLMNGSTLLSYRLFTMSSAFQSPGTGDFNGDGLGDMVWRNDARQLYFWVGDGAGFSNAYVATNAVGWSVIN